MIGPITDCVLPACAGVILTMLTASPAAVSITRMRGGDPGLE